MTKIHTCLGLLIMVLSQPSMAQKLPDGYILQYQQGFSGGKPLSEFSFNHPASWGIFSMKDNYYLQCAQIKDSADSLLLPNNIAVLDNMIFGDFVLEVDVMMPDTDTNGIGELCVFLGMKDLAKYYYVQIANICDSAHHGIYLVRKSVPSRLTGMSEKTVNWKTNKWQKLRLERNIVKRSILVFVDDMLHHVLQVKDYELVMGQVGLGSFSTPARFDNIKIWAPTVITNE